MSSMSQSQSRLAKTESTLTQSAIEKVNGKTPARGTSNHTRRAFGDISNRKVLRQNNSSHKNVYDGKTPGQTVDVMEIFAKAKYEPSANKDQKVLMNNMQPQELRRVGNVQFILPESIERSKSEFRLEATSKVSSLLDIPMDELEIEHSAGRLYQDQPSYDWDDETLLSIEGATTFRQDWIETLQEIHEYRLQTAEKKIQESILQLEQIALRDNDSTLPVTTIFVFFSCLISHESMLFSGVSSINPFNMDINSDEGNASDAAVLSPSIWNDDNIGYETDSFSLSVDFPPSP